ncbi:MAG TPA: RNA polymerase sigma factor RpoD/SigA [Solirubrobacteraceae bacterium]|jgi:RNA polymerase primary sigma factor|nr:RNA polymerase sigma factor RpoD/SigA [Solirubrobacteraceae bacterium]
MAEALRIQSDDELGPLIRRAISTPLLSASEEVELAIQIERGDAAARERMIESNLRLVVSLARAHRSRGVALVDLVQEGTIGLVHAVDRFDHRHGFKFSTYAVWWIRRSMRDAVARAQMIRIPPRANRHLAALCRAEEEVRQVGVPRSIAAVAERTGMSVQSVRSLQGAARVTASLDEPVGEDATPLGELVVDHHAAEPSESVVAAEESRIVRNMLELLPDRHRQVVVRRYGLGEQVPQSHEQVGASLGVGAERSRQLEREALHRLRTIAARQGAWTPVTPTGSARGTPTWRQGVGSGLSEA